MGDPGFRYYLITDRKQCGSAAELARVVGQACRNGIRAVQLREKDLAGKELLGMAEEIRTITSRWQAKLFVNDRADIAMAVGADGVHCRERGIGPADVKKLNPTLAAGASVHSLDAARKAEQDGADFLLFGPLYHTHSKAGYGSPQGIERLARVTESVHVPVFGVGGITPNRAKACLKAGAAGVAGISSIMSAQSVKRKVKQWETSLGDL